MRSIVALVLFLLCHTLIYSAETIELRGICVAPEKVTFGLVDQSSGSSAWVAIGDSFLGYAVSHYEAEEQAVTLTKGADVLKIFLRDAKVQEMRGEICGRIRVRFGKDVAAISAKLVYDRWNVFPVRSDEGDKMIRIRPRVQADGSTLYEAVFEEISLDRKGAKTEMPRIIGRPGQELSAKVGERELTFKPE
ncbi:MAG: hypothetical protein QM790_16450 [Nibricoccus sp.]